MTALSTVSGPVKAIAFLLFVAVLGGATWGVHAVVGQDVSLSAFAAQPVRDTLNASAGNTVTFAVTVHNGAPDATSLRVRLVGASAEGASDAVQVPGEGSATVFVPVAVPEGAAPGERSLDLEILTPAGEVARTRLHAATLRVLEPSSIGFAHGDAAEVVRTSRLADTGEVWFTNDPLLMPLNFAKEPSLYTPSAGRFMVRPNGAEPGFIEGMLGMQPGESRTFTVAPEDAYGDRIINLTTEREDAVERRFELPLQTEQLGRQAFDEFIQSSGQGDPAGFDVGDSFFFEDGPNKWTYVIDSMSGEAVEFRLMLTVGDTFTLYPYWEDASVVQSVNETAAVFHTTPTTAEGEAFTFCSYWPEMSAVAALNETHIIVRHDVPEGHKFAVGERARAQQPCELFPGEYTVTSAGDESIGLATPSRRALAGETLVFDVLMLSLEKA